MLKVLETSVIGCHSRQKGGQIGKVLIHYIPIWLLGQNVRRFYMLAIVRNALPGNDKTKTVEK